MWESNEEWHSPYKYHIRCGSCILVIILILFFSWFGYHLDCEIEFILHWYRMVLKQIKGEDDPWNYYKLLYAKLYLNDMIVSLMLDEVGIHEAYSRLQVHFDHTVFDKKSIWKMAAESGTWRERGIYFFSGLREYLRPMRFRFIKLYDILYNLYLEYKHTK